MPFLKFFFYLFDMIYRKFIKLKVDEINTKEIELPHHCLFSQNRKQISCSKNLSNFFFNPTKMSYLVLKNEN